MGRAARFREARLPKRLEQSLTRVDWQTREVLVGALRNRVQLEICLLDRFYHMPVGGIDPTPLRYIAIYQSQTLFGRSSGIYWYGRITGFSKVPRREIEEIPKYSDELYYRFEIDKWKQLSRPVQAQELPFVHLLTNLFLLRNSRRTPELTAASAHEFRYLRELVKTWKRAARYPKREVGFWFDGALTVFSRGELRCFRNGKLTAACDGDTLASIPYTAFESIYYQLYG